MYYQLRTGVLAIVALFFISTASMASTLGTYSQNFDGLDINAGEIGARWIYYINVFEDGSYEFGYGGAAPNTDQISGLVDNERDPGTQQLSVFSDYNCCTPDLGHNSAAGLVETNVFVEQTIAACNIGQTWTFTFDAKLGNLGGDSTAVAFIKVLDPLSGYSTTSAVDIDMTATPATWTSYSLDLPVGAWDGQVLQFGFQTEARNSDPSGVFYDNVIFSSPDASICPFSDDFESYNDTEATVLGDAGYLIFGNVSEPGGDFLFDYGPFPAPNQSGAFSGVSVGEGGPDQGAQQLVTFSDYNNDAAHSAGNLVESLFFREQTIGATNVGETWEFSFDARLGNLAPPTTAKAFIKTIDPANGYATTNEVVQDTTSTPPSWQSYQLSLPIDAGLVGQLIQIGFANTTTGYNSSGVFYDNIDFDVAAGSDSDLDGVDDSTDNCSLVANADQRDTNGDGHGNVCDFDYNNDCVTNFLDLPVFSATFNATTGDANFNEDVDFDGNGFINFLDFGAPPNNFAAYFLAPPGPSAAACVPQP